jgi:hypothetical protein
MTFTRTRLFRFALASGAGLAALFASESMSPTRLELTTTAEARIGRPLTPMSYAGVARRTTRRAYVAGAAGAAAVGAAAAGAAYYGSSCYQAVDAYGRVYTRCP